MRIRIVSRSFFEAHQGTHREAALLQRYSIISINSIGLPEKPPFSPYVLTKPNLLILRFDDVDEGFPNAMTDSQAQQIADFVKLSQERPFIIHCTAGISRSGAVGEVLNHYFNRHLSNDTPAFEQFYRNNPDIDPNSHVRQMLWNKLISTEV